MDDPRAYSGKRKQTFLKVRIEQLDMAEVENLKTGAAEAIKEFEARENIGDSYKYEIEAATLTKSLTDFKKP